MASCQYSSTNPVSIRDMYTLGGLRYSLEGDRPSQTDSMLLCPVVAAEGMRVLTLMTFKVYLAASSQVCLRGIAPTPTS